MQLLKPLAESLYPLWRLAAIAYYRWALHDMHPLHPDIPEVTLALRELNA